MIPDHKAEMLSETVMPDIYAALIIGLFCWPFCYLWIAFALKRWRVWDHFWLIFGLGLLLTICLFLAWKFPPKEYSPIGMLHQSFGRPDYPAPGH